MVAQRRESKGPERSHFLPLSLSVLWRTLTHYETLERSHLLSGLGFHFSYSKASGLSVSPDIIPWYLSFYTYCVQVDRHHASLHHITHVFQEGGGLLRALSPMKLGAEALALGCCLLDFQEAFVGVSVLDMVRPTLGTLPAFLLSHGGDYSSWPLCQDMGLQWWTKTDAIPNLMEFTV